MGTPSRRTVLAWTAAVLVAAVGGALFVIDLLTPTSFGWFAYTPTSGEIFSSEDIVVFTRAGAIGGVLFTAGLVTLAYLVGVRLGARRTGSQEE